MTLNNEKLKPKTTSMRLEIFRPLDIRYTITRQHIPSTVCQWAGNSQQLADTYHTWGFSINAKPSSSLWPWGNEVIYSQLRDSNRLLCVQSVLSPFNPVRSFSANILPASIPCTVP